MVEPPRRVLGTAAVVTVIVGLAVVCFAKGRVLHGVIGVFVPLLALVGAVRLGRPSSPWAKWRYDDAQRGRAAGRFAADRPTERLRRRLNDLVAGAPSKPD
jgi:hypothetical protein